MTFATDRTGRCGISPTGTGEIIFQLSQLVG
jgi:hypothetical protein